MKVFEPEELTLEKNTPGPWEEMNILIEDFRPLIDDGDGWLSTMYDSDEPYSYVSTHRMMKYLFNCY